MFVEETLMESNVGPLAQLDHDTNAVITAAHSAAVQEHTDDGSEQFKTNRPGTYVY